jgi:hypothetical protein
MKVLVAYHLNTDVGDKIKKMIEDGKKGNSSANDCLCQTFEYITNDKKRYE